MKFYLVISYITFLTSCSIVWLSKGIVLNLDFLYSHVGSILARAFSVQGFHIKTKCSANCITYVRGDIADYIIYFLYDQYNLFCHLAYLL